MKNILFKNRINRIVPALKLYADLLNCNFCYNNNFTHKIILILKFVNEWKIFLANKSSRNQFLISTGLLIILLFMLPKFLLFVENRSGVVLNDPVLTLFSPIDFTWLIFIIIYLSVFLTIIKLLDNPLQILKGIRVYALMVFSRMLAMYLIPLEPPPLMIELRDPLVEIIGGAGQVLTKDLFFSGHTATMFIMYLITKKNGLFKNCLLIATISIAILVLLQHIHYSIDVLTAFFISYTSFKVVENIGSD